MAQTRTERFIEVLTELGGSAGNLRLRQALGWNEDTYERTREVLIEQGSIVPGRGGSVSLAAEEPTRPRGAAASPTPTPPPAPKAPPATTPAVPARAPKANGNGGDLGPAAAPGACWCRPSASWRPTAGASASWPSTARRATTPPGGCAR